MNDSDFGSAWLKWNWAVNRAEELSGDIHQFLGDGAAEVRFNYQYVPRRHAFVVTCGTVTPLPPDWGLLLGEIAHNFRSALDHAAWAIVDRGRTPTATLTPSAQRGIYFPIAVDAADLRGRLRRYLPGARRADVALVRLFQPYRRGERMRRLSPIAILNDLNNADKHRSIQPTLMWPQSVKVTVLNQRDCVLTDTRTKARGVVMQAGAEVGTVQVRKTGPRPTAEIRFDDVSVDVCLPSSTSSTGPAVDDWLDRATYHIADLLHALELPPPEIAERVSYLGLPPRKA